MSLDDPDDPASIYLVEADAAILVGVACHPYELPTLPELCFAAGEFERELVHRRVEALVDRGLLETVAFDGDAPGPDPDPTFYGTTALGETVLERRLPPDRLQGLAEQYASLEKPPEIRRRERAPRPPR